jgi:transcriptional regulator with XRE-family HTH domain
MDHEALAADLIRALRGARSQAAFSRRLRYRSNVVRTWEGGRRWPTAARFLAICARVGVDPVAAVRRFEAGTAGWLDGVELASPGGVARLLDDLRGGSSIKDVALRAGRSRYAVSRWLSGAAEPRLPDFLRMIEATSLRLLDFLAVLVDPSALPSASKAWRELETARRVALELPWSHAVLRVLELRAYRALARHEPGFIAARAGISLEEERRCLRLLAQTRQIRKRGGLWEPHRVLTVDTRNNPDAGRGLLTFWAEVGVQRLRAGDSKGLFSYNLFTVSARDLERIRELHLSYFRQLRSIVAQSQPPERLVVANVQLFGLDA